MDPTKGRGSGIRALAMAVAGNEFVISLFLQKQGHVEPTEIYSVTTFGGACSNCGRKPSTFTNGEEVNEVPSTAEPFVVPKNPEAVRKLLADLANFARSLDR
ncbi:hypothetical protein WG66_010209 [Moniliophthora roreri]|nr:hypothetical protein WG66_010209 [Moniliophthora roreri]